jgi:hypothetical protein
VIRSGEVVVVYLRDPRERIWGVLRALDGIGVTVEGFDVDGFDSWLRDVESGSEGRERMSVVFFPMNRVERLLLDRGSRDIRSLSERFQERVGLTVADYLNVQPESDE